MECTPVSSSPLWDWDATAGAGADAAAGKRGGRESASASASASAKRGRQHHGGGSSSSAAGEAVAEAPRCQVEGCGLELGGYKEYYRKHRVCEPHTKCLRVVVAGQDRRFCQQCSRFHAPSEFDQEKRSCRRRLSDHNARRRKPQTDVFAFGSGTLPRSMFDDRQQISFTWDQAPLNHAKTTSSSSWTSDLQPSQVMDIGKRSRKAGADSANIRLSNALPSLCHDTNELLPIKGADASETASKLDGALDVQRALSLLSASSRGLTDPRHQASSIIQFANSNQNSRLPPSVPNEVNSNVSFWVDGQPQALEPQAFQFTMDTSNTVFPDLERIRPAYESTLFGLNQIH